MHFVRYKFRHIEHDNTTLCNTFPIYHPCSSDTCWWHHKMTVSNLYSTNCSGSPTVVWNRCFILVHLVHKPYSSKTIKEYIHCMYRHTQQESFHSKHYMHQKEHICHNHIWTPLRGYYTAQLILVSRAYVIASREANTAGCVRVPNLGPRPPLRLDPTSRVV